MIFQTLLVFSALLGLSIADPNAVLLGDAPPQRTYSDRVIQATQQTWDWMNYALHLSGLASCVGWQGIEYPFSCDSYCGDYPGMELIAEFGPKDIIDFSVSGFFSVDHTRKEIWHVFRGTVSLTDAVSDVRLDTQPFDAWGPNHPNCSDCQAHAGFLKSYDLAYQQFEKNMTDAFQKYPDYSLKVTGHSMGGAAAYVHGISMKTRGYDPYVVASGQPLVGNQALADYNDKLFFGDKPDFLRQDEDRRYWRLTHKGDLVPQIPFWSPFHQPGGEIYIDYALADPPLDSLKVCDGQDNPNCNYSSSMVYAALGGTLLWAHFQYFVIFTLCGVNYWSTHIHDG
uniref:triacylglycerol lipase n=1 Tax=Yarrowia yakushimensis TaxID=1527289 RepID=A0A078BMR5_9ASCO|nr:lipase [Yarrowia yakushimensis]